MNRKFQHFPRSMGTTLIEVLAGLVILSTLLVSLAVARGRFKHQWVEADQKLTAIKEMDHLLEQWLILPPQAVPISSQGRMENGSHIWRTQVIPNLNASSLGATVVRLQVFEQPVDQVPLSTLDFLLRDSQSQEMANGPR